MPRGLEEAQPDPPTPRGQQGLEDVLETLDVHELRALVRVSAAAGGAHHIEDVLEVAAEQTLEALGAASVSISRWDRDRGVLRTLINAGDLGPGEERWPEDEIFPLADYPGLVGLLQRGEPYVTDVDDPTADEKAIALLRELGKGAEIAAPIWYEGRLWGELWATTARDAPRPDEKQVRMCLALADQIAMAIGRAELFARVSALASRDPLTGLANRRAFDSEVDGCLAAASRDDGAATVVICDVDDFKAVNDRFGHDAGDATLCRVSDALSTAASEYPSALVGRMGGDEFCVLLPGSIPADGEAFAHRAAALLARDQSARGMGCSFGVAGRGPETASRRALLRAADEALYAAKRSGRGQVVVADRPGPELNRVA